MAAEDSNIERVRRLFEAFEKRELEQLLALTDPAIELLPVTASLANEGLPYLGHDGVARYLDDLEEFWDDLRLQPDDESEPRPGTVLVLGQVIARRRGAAEAAVGPASWVCRLRDGLIASCRVYPSHTQGLGEVEEF